MKIENENVPGFKPKSHIGDPLNMDVKDIRISELEQEKEAEKRRLERKLNEKDWTIYELEEKVKKLEIEKAVLIEVLRR